MEQLLEDVINEEKNIGRLYENSLKKKITLARERIFETVLSIPGFTSVLESQLQHFAEQQPHWSPKSTKQYLNLVKKTGELENKPAYESDEEYKTLIGEIVDDGMFGVLAAQNHGKSIFDKINGKKAEKLKLHCEYKLFNVNKLVISNLWVVKMVAKSFSDQGFDTEPITSDGILGLVRAAEKVDNKKNNHFSTYARYMVWRYFINAINNNRGVKIPSYIQKSIDKFATYSKKFYSENGREPYLEELSENFEMSQEKIGEIQGYWPDLIRLDRPTDHDSTATMHDFIGCIKPDQSSRLIDKEFDEILMSAVNELDPLLLDTVNMRCGWGKYRPHKLQEIGDKYGVTWESIRQRLKKAVKKIKQNKYIREIKYGS